jgi:YYY domain-containing protein
VPERYPLTSEYYRQLMGCPGELTIEECYNSAEPGRYQGALGFDLVKTFQSNPRLGAWEINDQPSEEAFTVYDHPKVFIFQKQADYSLDKVAAILSAVDLSKVIHITPKQADNHPGDLLLPLDRLSEQRAGGTWSDFFNVNSIQNQSQLVAAILWYGSVFLLGILVYPLLRYLLPGLSEAGYPLARTVGLLLLSYLVWLAGSAGIPFVRGTILAVLMLLAVIGLYLAYKDKADLIQKWNESKKYFIAIELLALGLFTIALLVRFGNPDLWHPWKGGERPMDFSYFNAVIKSTTFPPYDPWFAGGYINYYYYGFVFVGVLTKFLGIMPSLAYNLILPTLFMMIGLGGFTVVWNLLGGDSKKDRLRDLPYLGGFAGVLGLGVFGNLGVMRMVFQGIQRLASGGINVIEGSFFQRVKWTLLGLLRLINTPTLHYRLDEWYWNPSRVIGAEHGGPITEFPFFTFLYGDPHAHLIALPLTLLALAWVVSIIKSIRSGKLVKTATLLRLATVVFGALAVGVLRPTNTWDFYPYLVLGAASLFYAWWRERESEEYHWYKPALQLAVFILFAFLTFQPYDYWYGAGYTSIQGWFGSHTPINDYLIHWGFFLLIIVTWMGAETIEWMAATPVSALRNLVKIRELIFASLLILLAIMISLGVSLENPIKLGDFDLIGSGVHVIWLVLPLMAWALVLLLRPKQDLMKGFVLFLIGTALAITLMVELVYVEGDIGRMNTVFKFYLQAWTLFAVSAAGALCWLSVSARKLNSPVKNIWQVFFYFLLAFAALYPLLGSVAKIRDRMATEAPSSLDGMSYMAYATYYDLETSLDLSQDYQAIRWMQDNVIGSPVIVEANMVEYHWGTRYTVYTGLPGVVGWNWHQRQQRTLTPHEWVYSRVNEVNEFYDTTDLQLAQDFLEKYQVKYIILGQLERAKYLPEGIAKFEEGEGTYWQVVYQNQETTIYQTLLNGLD